MTLRNPAANQSSTCAGSTIGSPPLHRQNIADRQPTGGIDLPALPVLVELAARTDHLHFALLFEQAVIGQLALRDRIGDALRAVVQIRAAMSHDWLNVTLSTGEQCSQANGDAAGAHLGEAGRGAAATAGGIHRLLATIDLVDSFGLIAVVCQRVPGQIEMRIEEQSHVRVLCSVLAGLYGGDLRIL